VREGLLGEARPTKAARRVRVVDGLELLADPFRSSCAGARAVVPRPSRAPGLELCVCSERRCPRTDLRKSRQTEGAGRLLGRDRSTCLNPARRREGALGRTTGRSNLRPDQSIRRPTPRSERERSVLLARQGSRSTNCRPRRIGLGNRPSAPGSDQSAVSDGGASLDRDRTLGVPAYRRSLWRMWSASRCR